MKFVDKMRMKWAPKDYPFELLFATSSLEDIKILWREFHKDFANALNLLEQNEQAQGNVKE